MKIGYRYITITSRSVCRYPFRHRQVVNGIQNLRMASNGSRKTSDFKERVYSQLIKNTRVVQGLFV